MKQEFLLRRGERMKNQYAKILSFIIILLFVAVTVSAADKAALSSASSSVVASDAVSSCSGSSKTAKADHSIKRSAAILESALSKSIADDIISDVKEKYSRKEAAEIIKKLETYLTEPLIVGWETERDELDEDLTGEDPEEIELQVRDIPDFELEPGVFNFVTINLNDYVDTNVLGVQWSFSGNALLDVLINRGVAVITNWGDIDHYHREIITFTAHAGDVEASDDATFTVTGTLPSFSADEDDSAYTFSFNDIPNAEGSCNFGEIYSIDLNSYLESTIIPVGGIQWDYSGNNELFVSIEDGVASIQYLRGDEARDTQAVNDDPNIPYFNKLKHITETITFTATGGDLETSDDVTISICSDMISDEGSGSGSGGRGGSSGQYWEYFGQYMSWATYQRYLEKLKILLFESIPDFSATCGQHIVFNFNSYLPRNLELSLQDLSITGNHQLQVSTFQSVNNKIVVLVSAPESFNGVINEELTFSLLVGNRVVSDSAWFTFVCDKEPHFFFS